MIFLVKEFGDARRIVKTATTYDSRPHMKTCDTPFSPQPSYHQLTDEVHAWFLEVIGPRYHKEVAMVNQDNWIALQFNHPQTAMLFKLAWSD